MQINSQIYALLLRLSFYQPATVVRVSTAACTDKFWYNYSELRWNSGKFSAQLNPSKSSLISLIFTESGCQNFSLIFASYNLPRLCTWCTCYQRYCFILPIFYVYAVINDKDADNAVLERSPNREISRSTLDGLFIDWFRNIRISATCIALQIETIDNNVNISLSESIRFAGLYRQIE